MSPVYIYIIYIYTCALNIPPSWPPLFADHWTIWRWNISHKYNWGREDVTEEEVTSPQSPPSLHQGREAREPKEIDGLPPASFWRTQLDKQREWDRQKKSHQDEVGRRQPQKWADLCELRGEAIRGLTSQTNLQMKFILPPSEKIAFWRGGENIWRVSPPHWRNICK